ncbi:hypothetical protein RhiJN_20527 [Ceratobasidium sp. AG-Ba]|nr:hypothetical protein RhiJN_20527 [Ceratobasidium sp. AG-Ba]
MLNGNLSVWITDAQGNQLVEYQTRETDDESMECWIPSEEGKNFKIMWQPVRNFEPNLGLRCSIRLDGRGVSAGVISARDITRGIPGVKDGMSVSHNTRRLFVFSRQELTDQDDLAPPNGARSTQLGTIRVELNWVRYTGIDRPFRYHKPEEPGLLHERAKKGHSTTAALGAPVVTQRKSGRKTLKVDAGLPRAVFIFRYGPKDWLKAKEIIPREPVRERQSVDIKAERPRKRVKRELSPDTSISQGNIRLFDASEVIDIDDLPSEADSDVVVLNDPVEEKVPLILVWAYEFL